MTKGCACNSTTYKNNLVYSLTGSNRNSQLLIKRDAGWGSRAWLAGYCGSNARSTMSFSEIRQVGKARMGYIYIYRPPTWTNNEPPTSQTNTSTTKYGFSYCSRPWLKTHV
jgi:hypothetical protein